MNQRGKVVQRALRRFLRGQSAPVPLPALLNNWRRGFGGWSYVYYELAKHGRIDDYLPDITMRDMAALNGHSGRLLLTNKLVFERVVGTVAEVPKVLAAIGEGTVVPLAEPKLRTPADMAAYCREVGPLIFKPIDGGKGSGVLRLSYSAIPEGSSMADGLVLNGHEVTLTELGDSLARLDNFIVTAFAQQAPYAQAIFPDAGNTLRIVTMIDPNSGTPFIPATCHRFGMACSAPTDNFSRGGVWCRVDPDSGELGPAARDGHTEVHWSATHPESGAQIEGVVVEHWPEVKEAVLQVAAAVPYAPYVGWDILVSDHGPVVIEGNANPSLHSQMHFPYLRDERVRAFVEHHGVWRDRHRQPGRPAPAPSAPPRTEP